MSSRRIPVKPTLKRPVEDKEGTRRGVAMMIMLMFALFGLYNLFGGVSAAIGNINFIEAGRKAEARVEGIETVTSPRLGGFGTRDSRHARVSFAGENATAVSAIAATQCGQRCPEPGARVAVAYDSASPPRVLINDFTHIWGGPLESLLIATLSLLAVPVAYLFTRPPRKDLGKRS